MYQKTSWKAFRGTAGQKKFHSVTFIHSSPRENPESYFNRGGGDLVGSEMVSKNPISPFVTVVTDRQAPAKVVTRLLSFARTKVYVELQKLGEEEFNKVFSTLSSSEKETLRKSTRSGKFAGGEKVGKKRKLEKEKGDIW